MPALPADLVVVFGASVASRITVVDFCAGGAVRLVVAAADFDAVDFAICARLSRASRLPARFAPFAALATFWLRAVLDLAARASRLAGARAFATTFLLSPAIALALPARLDFLAACFFAACFFAACFFAACFFAACVLAVRSSALELGE